MKNLIAIAALILSQSALAAGVSGAPLTTVNVGGKTLLANSQGMTAYTFDPDKPGISNCNGGCAQEWPPIVVPAGTAVTAPFSIITRRDGSHQVAYNSHPLYLYADDQKPGDTNGDGAGGVWHVVVDTN